MSIVVSVPFGVASAIVYGSSIVVQHRVAQATSAGCEDPSAAGLMRLLKHPIFLLAIAGDAVGFALQIVALTTGSVVVIQPLVVLMLPVALIVSSIFGGPRPRPTDYLSSFAVVAGLGVFLALVNGSSDGHVPRPRILSLAIGAILLVSAALAVFVTGRSRLLRGAVYGAVAGLCFGTLAVMVDAASDRAGYAGVYSLFTGPRGFVPLLGILVLGGSGIVMTQLSFQVGALNATLPANLAVDPVTGVVLGAVLLHERLPLSPWHLAAYLLCLAAVVAGTIRLAEPRPETVPEPAVAAVGD